MRRLAVFLSLLCLLSLPVSAAYIPESSVTENRDGRQLIIKTYQLSPEDDPSELVDEPFDLEGYHYEHLETVKEDQTFHDSKAHTETVTVTTSSDSLAAILEQLAPTMEYSKDGYSGVLTLDHTTLQTEAAGYTTKYYTITDTKQFTGLPRNDPSYVPTTTVKDGKTLSLSNISWAVTGTGLADDTLVPTSYTATATYQATAGTQRASSSGQPPVGSSQPTIGTAWARRPPGSSQHPGEDTQPMTDMAGAQRASDPSRPPVGGTQPPVGTAGTRQPSGPSRPSMGGTQPPAGTAGTRQPSSPSRPPVGGTQPPAGTAGARQPSGPSRPPIGGTQASTGAKESRRISGAPRPPTIQTASEETTAKDSSAGTHRIKRPAAPPNGNTSKKRNKKK